MTLGCIARRHALQDQELSLITGHSTGIKVELTGASAGDQGAQQERQHGNQVALQVSGESAIYMALVGERHLYGASGRAPSIWRQWESVIYMALVGERHLYSTRALSVYNRFHLSEVKRIWKLGKEQTHVYQNII